MADPKNLDKVLRQLDSLADIDQDKALLAGANKLLAEIIEQPDFPFDTGFLKSSGKAQKEGQETVVEFTAGYSWYVEYGTARTKAHPYVRPVLDNKEKIARVVASVQKQVEKQIKEKLK